MQKIDFYVNDVSEAIFLSFIYRIVPQGCVLTPHLNFKILPQSTRLPYLTIVVIQIKADIDVCWKGFQGNTATAVTINVHTPYQFLDEETC